jgi:hypothetical protein
MDDASDCSDPLPLPPDDERVTYAPKVGIKCQECGRIFNAVKCPECGAIDFTHPLVLFGERVRAVVPLVGSGEP